MWWILASVYMAGELQVLVDSPEPGRNPIGCRLYDLDSAGGFPGGDSDRQTRASADETGRLMCVFDDLSPGRYAVAALLDQNQNDALDTSRLGLPLEPWGVTNNVRPSFRAPSFDEAAVVIPADGLIQATVVLQR